MAHDGSGSVLLWSCTTFVGSTSGCRAASSTRKRSFSVSAAHWLTRACGSHCEYPPTGERNIRRRGQEHMSQPKQRGIPPTGERNNRRREQVLMNKPTRDN